MKFIFSSLLLFVSVSALMIPQSLHNTDDCFDDLFSAGMESFNKCDCTLAEKRWKAALHCSEVTFVQNQKANEWLLKAQRCDCRTPPPPNIEPEMIFVKGGTFQMGDVMNDSDDADEKIVHTVILNSFQIAKHELTQLQWRALMGQDPPELHHKGCDQCPVERVSYPEVQAYIQKLNEVTGKKYRLPTEAEWEFAAREGGKKIRFGNGHNIADPSEINFDARMAAKKAYSVVGIYRSGTIAVGSFPPNSLGLFDMSGNVWEWCNDWYEEYNSVSVANPAGPTTGSRRISKGGGWGTEPLNCRTSARRNSTPTSRLNALGFRLALTFN